MLKIPKQIYFEQDMLELYSAYAKAENKSFASVIRDILQKGVPQIKEKVVSETKTTGILDFYGAGKRFGQKRYSIKEERKAFMDALSDVKKEKRYAR